MDKLKPLNTPELRFFQGYIAAASEVLIRGQLEATLEACGFEILDSSVATHEVLAAAYPDHFVPIDYVAHQSPDQLESEVNAFLTVERGFWKSNSVPSQIETNLRAGYWKALLGCFDYRNSQVFAVGNDVPYVNLGFGFTYVLINKQVTRSLVLVGNTTD